jgi:hypothetical protein
VVTQLWTGADGVDGIFSSPDGDGTFIGSSQLCRSVNRSTSLHDQRDSRNQHPQHPNPTPHSTVTVTHTEFPPPFENSFRPRSYSYCMVPNQDKAPQII